ncbi:hypothetical protein BGP_2634 [Beggiatoa sp. PS]|nr:hypothetical protein BGP_2634 [Beggiatoa sp. PS]
MPLLAGDLNSPAAPGDANSAMYTIENICNRLDNGTAGAKRTGTFTEPAAAPSSTGCTLDDVMTKAPPKTPLTEPNQVTLPVAKPTGD